MSSILRLIYRKIGEKIVKLAVDVAKEANTKEISKNFALDLVECTSSLKPLMGLRRAASPWILPPIWEEGEMVFRSYTPSKGEILSLHKHNKTAAAKQPEYSDLSSMPWLMLPPASVEGEGMLYKFYSPTKGNSPVSLNSRGGKEEAQLMLDTHTKLVGSSHGWLASFNERSGDLFLSNPLSGRRIKLPPPPVDKPPLKVIISCSPDEEECRALMSFGLRRLAFCCPGRSKEWTPIGSLYKNCLDLKCVRGYDDFVYSTSQKCFFSVLEDESIVEAWDLGDPLSPRLVWESHNHNEGEEMKWDDLDDHDQFELTDKDWCRRVRYLVFAEHSDQLFMVTRYIMDAAAGSPVEDTKTIDFEVHRINQKGGTLCYMNESLDGLVMFVGINHSFALPASQFPANSICFTHGKDGYDIGIFDYSNRTCLINFQCFNWIQPPPLWFTPNPY